MWIFSLHACLCTTLTPGPVEARRGLHTLLFLSSAYVGVCLCTVCAPVPLRAQKRASVLLELGLQVVVSCRVGAGNRAQVLWGSNWCSSLKSPLSGPFFFLFFSLFFQRGVRGLSTGHQGLRKAQCFGVTA